MVAKRWPNFLHQRRIVSYETTTPPFSQKQLDLPQAKAERRGREPAAEVRVGDGFMSASLNRLSPDYQNGLP
jgi:hypothetical protein